VNPLGVGRHAGLCRPRIATRILDALVALEFARSAPSASFVDLGVGVGVIAIEM
jgi:methylase of polypeptide subunit release factors